MVVPVLARVENEVVKAHYVKKLAEVLGVGEEAVAREVAKRGRKEEVGEGGREEKQEEKSREELLADYVLALVLQGGEGLKKWLEERKLEEGLGEGGVREVLERFREWLGKGGGKMAEFVKGLPEELKMIAGEAFVRELAVEEERWLEEVGKSWEELKRLRVRKQLAELAEAIRKAEREGRVEEAERYQKEVAALTKRLREREEG